MKSNKKEIIIDIIIPIVLGGIIGIITKNHPYYIKSSLTPPDIVFPIAWTIFYGLLGLSHYYIKHDKKANKIYWIQLIINLIWPIIFFKIQAFLLSFVWLLILDVLVVYMLLTFKKISKKAFYMNIPYFFWLIFATILSYMTYLIN